MKNEFYRPEKDITARIKIFSSIPFLRECRDY